MVRIILIDNYQIVFKNDQKVSLDYVYPKYEETYMQIIFDNHISIAKKKKSTEWWLVVYNGLQKVPNTLLVYDEKGLSVPKSLFDHGVIFINYGENNKDLDSVIYLIDYTNNQIHPLMGKKYILIIHINIFSLFTDFCFHREDYWVIIKALLYSRKI